MLFIVVTLVSIIILNIGYRKPLGVAVVVIVFILSLFCLLSSLSADFGSVLASAPTVHCDSSSQGG